MNSDTLSLADFRSSGFTGCLLNKVEAFGRFLANMQDKQHDLYRLETMAGPDCRVVVRDPMSGTSQEMIMLTSSNYLGFSNHPAIQEAMVKGIQTFGTQSGGSHLLSGSTKAHVLLAERIADFFNYEEALIFPSGYATNGGVISALAGRNDVIIMDKLVHASIIDGAVLSGAQIKMFPHGHVPLLEKKLKSCASNTGVLVIVDGVYSMAADLAPLKEILALKEKYRFTLLVDDAHATGVLGERGRGTASHFGVEGVDLLMSTLSKSIGGYGGFVTGSRQVINYLRYYARSAMYSSNIPPAIAAGCTQAFDILDSPEGVLLIQELHHRVHFVRDLLMSAGLEVKGHRDVPIIILPVGNDLLIRRINRALHLKGVFVNAIPAPAVPPKDRLIRLRVSVRHSFEDLAIACEAIVAAFAECRAEMSRETQDWKSQDTSLEDTRSEAELRSGSL